MGASAQGEQTAASICADIGTQHRNGAGWMATVWRGQPSKVNPATLRRSVASNRQVLQGDSTPCANAQSTTQVGVVVGQGEAHEGNLPLMNRRPGPGGGTLCRRLSVRGCQQRDATTESTAGGIN